MKPLLKFAYCLFIIGLFEGLLFLNPASKLNYNSGTEQISLSNTERYISETKHEVIDLNSAYSSDNNIFSSDRNLIHKYNSPLKRLKTNSFNSGLTGKNNPDPALNKYISKHFGHSYVNMSYLKFLRISKMLC